MTWLLHRLEALGTPAGWIVALLQLGIWAVGGPVLLLRSRKRRKEEVSQHNSLKMRIEELEEALGEAEDQANEWRQMTKQAVLMMRARCKDAYRDFIEFYGGEDQFRDWWQMPKE